MSLDLIGDSLPTAIARLDECGVPYRVEYYDNDKQKQYDNDIVIKNYYDENVMVLVTTKMLLNI